MPKIVISWYDWLSSSQLSDESSAQIETIVREFVDELGDSGGVFELQHAFYAPPSTCDSGVVVEAHYAQTDDRNSIQLESGQMMKFRLEKLLNSTVSIRLLPKDYAVFIK